MSLDEAIGQLEKLVAEIRRVSFTDDKTPLGNALALAQEERRIIEGTSEFDVVAFGDLNGLKQLNDVYGHEAGDLAIKRAGETIHGMIVKGLQARAFRPNGDEFVVLLRQDSVDRLVSSASSFGDILFSHKEQELRTAMSFGYVRSDGKTSFRDLLGRAEDACQHAKALGDGACVEWTQDIKINPLLRKSGTCLKCTAKITCSVPAQNAPAELRFCPCCGASL